MAEWMIPKGDSRKLLDLNIRIEGNLTLTVWSAALLKAMESALDLDSTLRSNYASMPSSTFLTIPNLAQSEDNYQHFQDRNSGQNQKTIGAIAETKKGLPSVHRP